MTYIKNIESILSHGNKELRKDAIAIIEQTLTDCDPYKQVKKMVSLENNLLKVGELKYNLDEYANVYVIGAGKASYPIVKALDDILGERITEGVVTLKYGQEADGLKRIKANFANHPTPDAAGVIASEEIMQIAKKTKEKDIVFCGITGGSTSLMPMPVDGISIDELTVTYDILLKCGANIVEMNAVRKKLCKIKGGRLVKNIHKKAEIINLTVSDVIGDMLDYITCPTVPDTSTLNDARNTFTKYSLWDRVPPSVAAFLQNATEQDETPKDLSDHNIHNFILVKGDAPCLSAKNKAEELGYNAMILSTMLEGESREVGGLFAAIGKEILAANRPIARPCVIIGGGETTVKITGNASGSGGPNQEFALAGATWIDGSDDILIAGIDSDGTDGHSDLAGGVVDNWTMSLAREKNINVFEALNKFDTSPILRDLQDAIHTGATGTNVNDLKLMLIK
jgi:glycerate-2-kinase